MAVAISGRRCPTRAWNSSTRFSIGVPVRNSTRSRAGRDAGGPPATAWRSGSSRSGPRRRRAGPAWAAFRRGCPAMPNVVTATPPCAPPCAPPPGPGRSPCRATTGNVECWATSRVQLMSTLAGHTTRKWVAPFAARWRHRRDGLDRLAQPHLVAQDDPPLHQREPGAEGLVAAQPQAVREPGGVEPLGVDPLDDVGRQVALGRGDGRRPGRRPGRAGRSTRPTAVRSRARPRRRWGP